jgi:hypothetical protein
MNFYRYEDINTYDGPRIVEKTYNLVKETTHGYWINNIFLFFGEGKRWVSKTSRKRFAYPTKNEALQSFIARKTRQITILQYNLKRAQESLQLATIQANLRTNND